MNSLKKSWHPWVPIFHVFQQKNRHNIVDQIYYRPFIPLLIALIAGIICSNQTAFPLWPVCLAGSIVSSGSMLLRLYLHENSRFSPIFLFFFLGCLLLTPWRHPADNKHHIQFYLNDQKIWKIAGIIEKEPLFQTYRSICILNHIQLSDPATPNTLISVQGKIRVIIYGTKKSLNIGEKLIFKSKIKAFKNFKNPGGFDYVKYMTFHQIWGNSYTSFNKMVIVPSEKSDYEFSRIRQKIKATINQASRGDSNAVLQTLLLGNRQELNKPMKAAFNRAGISHVLAISGLHIGIVASFSFWIFSWLLSQFHFFLRHAWTRKGAAILSIIPILIYGILSGMSPSTQRAIIMVIVFLLTFLVEQEQDGINTLAMAALLILLIHPPSLFSISFQLSFAAVFSIIWGVPKIIQFKEKPQKPLMYIFHRAYTFILISAFAIMGTAPLVLFYFNQISLIGILSNLLFIPVIGFMVVPLGLFSVLILLPLSSLSASIGIGICDHILSFSIKWIFLMADMPYAAIKTITPSKLEIICIYTLIIAALMIRYPENHLIRKSFFKTPIPAEKSKKKIRSLFILTTALFILSMDIFYWIYQRYGNDSVRISIIDVGQGNAALIELPKGTCALIDGGGYNDNSIFDIGEKVLAPFLWQKKIKTIETVMLTHYDSDHLNGLLYILQHFNVQQVLATHDPNTCMKNKTFRKIIQTEQIDYPEFKQFAKTQIIHGAMLKILYPPEDFSKRLQKDAWRNSNNNSMIIQVSIDKKNTVLFPGDIMDNAEKEILKMGIDLHATIMIAPHHGSNSSSSQAFIEAVNPDCVIISSGFQNKFGFPSSEVMERYKKNNIKTLKTEINGNIYISKKNNAITLSPFIGEKIRIRN